jgi:hypothetical protein
VGFVKICCPKSPGLEEFKHGRVDLRPDGLHDIQSHRLTPSSISMHDSQTWIEANREAGYPRLCLKDCIEVIEYGVGWIYGQPRGTSE